MIRDLKNWWFLRKHGYPSKSHMWEILLVTNIDVLSRSYQMGLAYVQTDATIESVAAAFDVSRERVRQVLLKLHRSVR